ncbi:MAG TPA: DHA2 family efflux MFS transporter permease subunit [Vicinamibacterales bacterium]
MDDASGAAAASSVNPWLTAIAVMSATFMVVLDTTVVNVSLPHIAGNLSSTIEETTWALTSYLAANAIVLPLTGWLATVIGRKRLLMASVAGFSMASLLCGIAPNLPVLIGFRVVQGITGGVMQPISQAVLLEAFDPADRGKAMGFWGLGIVVAPIIGPVLGGWLTDNYSWRWVFYINVPVGVLSLLMVQAYIFDPPYLRRASEVIDYWGIGLLAIGIAGIQIMLDQGQQEDWFASSMIVTLLIVGSVSLVAFVARELRTRHPVVDLSVFRDATYSAGVLLTTVLGFVLYGSLVLLPVMLQTLMGYSSVQAGLALAPRGLGSFIAMPLVGLATDRFDPRKLVGIGLVLAAYTLFWLSWLNLDAGYWDLFWPQFLQGLSLGLLFVPLTAVTMGRISRERMGNATSLFNLMRNVGSSVGIAVVTTMLSRRQTFHADRLSAHVSAYSTETSSRLSELQAYFISQGADATTALMRAYAALEGMVRQQAALLSFIDAFYLMGVIFAAMLPLLFLMRRPDRVAEGVHAVME